MNNESTKQTVNQGIVWAAWIAVGAVLMVSCASSPQETTAPTAISSPAPQREFEVVNVMPDFWRFWEMAKDKPPPTQQTLFKKYVIEKHPELFTREVLGLKKTIPYNQALEIKLDWYFKRLPGLIPAMKRLSGILPARLLQYTQSFRSAFPDFSYAGKIYITLSLGAFDGGTRKVNGDMPLLFGVDGIAMWHDPKWNPAAFFHHELFHLYHGQFVPEPRDGYPPLYLALWCEGLAVHVSKALNPAASNEELLLQDLPDKVPPLLEDLAIKLRAHLVSTRADDYDNFFQRSTDPKIPSRSGYFIGMLIAKRLAESRNLQQLARLKGRELQGEIDQALATLSGASNR